VVGDPSPSSATGSSHSTNNATPLFGVTPAPVTALGTSFDFTTISDVEFDPVPLIAVRI